MKQFDSQLKNLQSQATKLTESGLALNSICDQEDVRLKREDEASSLRALYRTIVEELDRMKYSESSVCYEDIKANLAFSVAGLAAKIIVATTKDERAWNAVNSFFDMKGRKEPFGTVMVCVGPKGLPDDVRGVCISQLAREAGRSQPEIMGKLQNDGHLLFSREAFSVLINKLIGDVREGRLTLPVSRNTLAEIVGLNKPKPSIRVIETG